MPVHLAPPPPGAILQKNRPPVVHTQFGNLLKFEHSQMIGSVSEGGAMTDKQLEPVCSLPLRCQRRHAALHMVRDTTPGLQQRLRPLQRQTIVAVGLPVFRRVRKARILMQNLLDLVNGEIGRTAQPPLGQFVKALYQRRFTMVCGQSAGNDVSRLPSPKQA